MANDSNSIRVQPYTGYRNASQLRVSARVLRGNPPDFSAKGLFGTMRTMAALYASREVAGLRVKLQFADGTAHSATSDNEGFVHFDVPAEAPLPETLKWDAVTLLWDDGVMPISESAIPARILAPAHSAAIGMISDIDDTILETGITGSARAILRNVHRVFAQLPQDRRLVPGAPAFFNALTKTDTPDERACFYVSSSPWNLYPYLRAYKELRDLPSGPLMLRDWGLNRNTLGSGSHGAHKTGAILQLLSDFPAKRFVLIGDDTQRDPVAFSQIVATHPNRIAAVFIRRAAKLPSADEAHARAVMEANSIPFWMGADFTEAHGMLAQSGLA